MPSLAAFHFLCFGLLITGVSVSLMVAFFPLYSKKYDNIDETFIGLVFAMNPIGGVISSILVGKLLNKGISFFTCMSAGLIILSMGFVLLTIIEERNTKESLQLFSLLGRFITGFGARTFETPFFALIPIYFQETINNKMTIAQIASSIGYVSGPIFGSFLYEIGGFKLPFIVLTFITIIMSIIIILLFNFEQPYKCQMIQQREIIEISSTESETKIGYFQLLKLYTIFSSLCMLFSMCIMYTYYHPTIAQYFSETFQVDQIEIGYFVSLKSLSFGIASFIISFFSFNKINAIAISMFIMSIAQFFMGPDPLTQLQPKIQITIISQLIIGAFSSCSFIYALPTMVNFIQEKYENNHHQIIALISGLLNASESLGNIIGPIAGGLVAEHYPFQRSASFLGIFLLIISFVYLPNCIKMNKMKLN